MKGCTFLASLVPPASRASMILDTYRMKRCSARGVQWALALEVFVEQEVSVVVQTS